MSRKNSRFSSDVLAVGAAAFAGSVLTQRILLQPKTEISVFDSFKLPVSGIMPLSQKYIAEISRKAFNDIFPVTMGGVIRVCEAIRLREQIKRFTIWFLYDFLSKYSLNSLFSFFSGRLKIVDREKYKQSFQSYVQKLIMEKDDRDEIIRAVTVEIVMLMRLVTEGTVAALIFNERVAEAASGTVSAAVDRFLRDDAASRVTDYVFGLFGKLEGATVSGILTDTLKIGRSDMAHFIDSTYNAFLGPDSAGNFRDMHLGDSIYDMVSTVDYNRAFDCVSSGQLLKIDVSSALVAMGMYSTSKKIARKVYRHKNRIGRVADGVKTLFSDRKFLEEPKV